MSAIANLADKEQALLRLAAEGKDCRAIAKALDFSPGTVRVYLHKLYIKLGVKNRTEAILLYLREQASPPPPAPATSDTPITDALVKQCRDFERTLRRIEHAPSASKMRELARSVLR